MNMNSGMSGRRVRKSRDGWDHQQSDHEGASRAGRSSSRVSSTVNGIPQNVNDGRSFVGVPVYDHGGGRSTGISPEYVCQDGNCDKPIIWRNTNDNRMDRPVSFRPNHEEREIQMKLLDILSETGLCYEDIGILGSKPLAFDTLTSVPSSIDAVQGVPSNTGMEQQRSVAWICAKFDTEREEREWLFNNRNPKAARIPSKYCEERRFSSCSLSPPLSFISLFSFLFLLNIDSWRSRSADIYQTLAVSFSRRSCAITKSRSAIPCATLVCCALSISLFISNIFLFPPS